MDKSIRQFIDELQNRQIHTTLDATILADIPDDKVELAVVDYVHAKLAGCQGDEVEVLASLPEGVRALYLTWGVETEVINGGFSRYYWKWIGQFAQQAVAAFEFFAAHEHAELMREANRARAEEGAAVGDHGQHEATEEFSDAYLEERFYQLDESLSALRIARIRSHPALFSGD